ncbi:Single cache domain-containing protein [Gammaproteobacteria bacterium]
MFYGIKKLTISMGFMAFLVGTVTATDIGTADEAKSMCDKAVAAVKADGREKTFAAIQDTKGSYRMKDLYVFCMDMKGVMLAHGAKPELIGKNLLEKKDPDGKPLFQEMIKTVQEKNAGWVDYKWPHPETKVDTAKSSYVQMADPELFCGVGIYKQ